MSAHDRKLADAMALHAWREGFAGGVTWQLLGRRGKARVLQAADVERHRKAGHDAGVRCAAAAEGAFRAAFDEPKDRR